MPIQKSKYFLFTLLLFFLIREDALMNIHRKTQRTSTYGVKEQYREGKHFDQLARVLDYLPG
jgi:hypothetical protein